MNKIKIILYFNFTKNKFILNNKKENRLGFKENLSSIRKDNILSLSYKKAKSNSKINKKIKLVKENLIFSKVDEFSWIPEIQHIEHENIQINQNNEKSNKLIKSQEINLKIIEKDEFNSISEIIKKDNENNQNNELLKNEIKRNSKIIQKEKENDKDKQLKILSKSHENIGLFNRNINITNLYDDLYEYIEKSQIYEIKWENFQFDMVDYGNDYEKSNPNDCPEKEGKKDSFGNITFEYEPDDINKYSCSSFDKILNNCSPKNNEWELIPPEIAVNQLKQEVGNCYMVSALESLSHIPFLLLSIFGENFSSNQKKFKLTFKKNDGKSEYYITLNRFPIYGKKKI